MDTIINSNHNHLIYNDPSNDDYSFFTELFEANFYQYVKSKWTLDDILEENSLLPFTKDKTNTNLEFNYVINNKDQERIAYVKGFYPLDNRSLWIQILAVNTPFLRQGYGQLIMKELVQHFVKENSITHIYLTCHKQNIPGIDFWESLGFQKIYNIKSTHGLYVTDLRSLTCIPNHSKP